MSVLTRLLFRSPAVGGTTHEVIGWWESRRLPFNIAVGTAGLVTLAILNTVALFNPLVGPIPVEANVLGPVVYGVLANFCYTSGWMAELAIRRRFGEEYAPIGPVLFRYGLVFSIGLTLFPILLGAFATVLMVLKRIF